MPFSIDIEPETGFATITCSGTLTIRDAREALSALWNTPEWSRRAAVWDFRASRFDITPAQAREIAGHVLRGQPSPAASRVAFVVGSDADFGLARVFEVFRADPRTAFRVFRDYPEAVIWTRLKTDAP